MISMRVIRLAVWFCAENRLKIDFLRKIPYARLRMKLALEAMYYLLLAIEKDRKMLIYSDFDCEYTHTVQCSHSCVWFSGVWVCSQWFASALFDSIHTHSYPQREGVCSFLLCLLQFINICLSPSCYDAFQKTRKKLLSINLPVVVFVLIDELMNDAFEFRSLKIIFDLHPVSCERTQKSTVLSARAPNRAKCFPCQWLFAPVTPSMLN